ncbi:MAG: class I SAM-dependent methyltransferase [Sarcina sp.]
MSEKIDFEFIKNAAFPEGDDGVQILSNMNENHGNLTSWGFEHLKFGRKILDIGCGGGGAISRLAKIYPDSIIEGCDISETSINCSKEKNEKLIKEGRLKLKVSTVSNLDYPNDEFDSVYSIESLYFWPNQQEDLKEVYRILKKGGSFMTALEMVGGSLSEKSKAIAEHLEMNCPSPNELENLLKNAGFLSVKIDYNKENNWLCAVATK